MADVRPFRALRYAPGVDLATAVCPPFDTISPEQQQALHKLSPHNAVRIELAEGDGGSRYERAAAALREWLAQGVLRRDERPAFYLYRQGFEHGGRRYTRTIVFVRVRLAPWEKGEVLPHEQTFGAPKEDRLQLLRATRLNSSPVYLLYRDRGRAVSPRLEALAGGAPPEVEFRTQDGQTHALCRLDDPGAASELAEALRGETLYVADGHHRYETALAYREERRAAADRWTGEEPENFALAALTAVDDPGLVVLPIHRVTAVGAPPAEAMSRLEALFHVAPVKSPDALSAALGGGETGGLVFGLAAAGLDDLLVLTPRDPALLDPYMPADRSPRWRRLNYAIANHVILRHAIALTDEQMHNYDALWFTEDAAQAVEQVRTGKARYAVLLNPVRVTDVLDVADSGERMPQKSTFFYPKVPTGLVFNPLED